MSASCAAPPETIDRRADLPYRAFAASYLRPHRPVVLPGSFADWPALSRWSPQFFRDRYADKELPVAGRTYRLAEFLDLVERSDDENPAPYLFGLLIDEHFPELLPDFAPWPAYLAPNWLDRRFLPGNLGRRLYNDRRANLFIGGRGGFCKLHYDIMYHSYSFQLFGEKLFFLYPPGQAELLYPTAERPYLSSINDVARPDLAKYPRFAEAAPQTCVLGPGDLLFIPAGWWHATRMLGPSVSVSVNTANGANWPAVVQELSRDLRAKHPRLAGPAAAALRLVGAAKTWKDRLTGP